MRNFFLFLVLASVITVADAQQKDNLKQDIANPGIDTNQALQNSTAPDSTNKNSSASFASNKPSPDSVIRIGLILPFDAQNSTDKLNASMDDKEPKSDNNNLKESTTEALDFYEGVQYALNKDSTKQKIALYVFDSQNSDSMVQELMKDDQLRACNIIIGPTTSNQAKIVATFCKKNKIINIQPFVASKSFSSENEYLVRFMPTIDAHLQKEYEMVMDSFSDANIIIYTTKRYRDITAARQLDTLFKSYNDINPHKISYTFFNSSDSSLPTSMRSLGYYIHPNERNVVMMTCYDEPVINSQLRTIKEGTLVFGMPTWIDADQIRADYLNKAEPYFTDNYYVDTSQAKVNDFISGYNSAYSQKPSRYSYLGYDAMRYLYVIFAKYGKAFSQGFDNESYDGLGYSFHISPVIRTSKATGDPVINYYTNTAMHLFQLSDYKVLLIN